MVDLAVRPVRPGPVAAARNAASPRPKTSWKKSEKGLVVVPKSSSISSGETVRYSTWGPPPELKGVPPGRPARSQASKAVEWVPTSSYLRRFSGSPSTS